MKLLLFTFLLLPAASSAQAPAPRQADQSAGSTMPVLGQARPGCTSVLRQVVGPEQRRPGQRLDQQPPAKMLYAVDRHVNGCREVTLVGERR